MFPAFMLTPLFKWGAAIVAVLVLLGTIWFGVENAIHKHDEAIRAQLVQQQQTEALAQAAKDQAADKKFDQLVQDQKTQDAVTLNEVHRANDAAVTAVKSSIRSQIASGALTDRPASPLINDTVNQIEQLRAAREKAQ